MSDELIAGVTALAGTSLGGSLTVATVPVAVTTTTAAGGIAGLLGFTTTATTIVASPVVVPLAGAIALGAALTYGGLKAYEFLKDQQSSAQGQP